MTRLERRIRKWSNVIARWHHALRPGRQLDAPAVRARAWRKHDRAYALEAHAVRMHGAAPLRKRPGEARRIEEADRAYLEAALVDVARSIPADGPQPSVLPVGPAQSETLRTVRDALAKSPENVDDSEYA